MSGKAVKIKSLADKLGVSAQEILKELKEEGFDVKSVSGSVPADVADLIGAHFEELRLKKEKKKKQDEEAAAAAAGGGGKELHLKTPIVVKHLAEVLGKKPNEVITHLMSMNILANINQAIDRDEAAKVCEHFGFSLIVDRREKEEHQIKQLPDETEEAAKEEDKPESLKNRPPVVTFMGHVDHGKTSLQDYIRKSKVAAGEHGGITQHIGASVVTIKGKQITFIDTPGHEAFTAMRARGADVTDIAVLVVAADDGFMPQTVEALNHARAAKVPVIVAINKIDLPSANPEKVYLNMQQNNLMCEEWGGEVGTVKVSARTGAGIDQLLERILLESEMMELKANPDRQAKAVVLESQLEQGLGPTANILVQNGTLNVGDAILCDQFYGRVKTMIDVLGNRVKKAGPSTPVKLVGLSGVPDAGSRISVCKDEREARAAAENKAVENRNENLAADKGTSFEEIFSQLNMGNKNDLKILLKSDVKGSGEAIIDSLKKIPSEKIKVEVLSAGVGAITENDVMLASASKAIIVGFHVRVNPGVNDLAKKQKIEIRLYSIIYELLEDITDALTGRLEPDKREKPLGSAKILKIFELTKGPKVCGCMVEKGYVRVGAKARVFRNSEIIYNGEVRSLRRFQDDVRDVKAGLECGIKLDNFMDFEENDLIDFYEIELKKATLA